RLRKVLLAGLTANIENVAAFRVALEIDEVDDAFGLHCRLRLDAAAGSAEQTHLRSAIAGPADHSEENQCKRGSQNELEVVFHNYRLLIHFTINRLRAGGGLRRPRE